jgi:ribosomal protein S2
VSIVVKFQYITTYFLQEGDITKMLAATAHLGSSNSEVTMLPYVFKRKNDGTNIINLKKTWFQYYKPFFFVSQVRLYKLDR